MIEAPALALIPLALIAWPLMRRADKQPLPCPSCKWSDGGCNKLPTPDCGDWEQWRADYE